MVVDNEAMDTDGKEKQNTPYRYGVGELYGYDLGSLKPKKIREFSKAGFKTLSCPFKGGGEPCNKKGGVCSLRPYVEDTGDVIPLEGTSLVATCPSRFQDDNTALSWVADTLLHTRNPLVIRELPFLMSTREKDHELSVGKIDMVLVHPDTSELRWCALEIQAVYFSGDAMSKDFKVMKSWKGPGIPFPEGRRHPDFRSSGPKRLMPQMQIKVPTISRWGKKMAVVVDLPFWNSLGPISEVEHVSNCDIAWFVMGYRKHGKRFKMEPHGLHLTTLDRAVEGLTAGKPTSLSSFELSLREKLECS